MIGRLIEIGGWLRRRAENVAVALLSLMFASFIIQIFFRYVLNNPVGWTEEVIVTTWLWTVLWGAAFILGEAEEVLVERPRLGDVVHIERDVRQPDDVRPGRRFGGAC